MHKLLSEATSVPVATGKPGRWRATVLTVGQGSSGNWLQETVKRDGPHALKKGAKCFVTHNRMENGEPDPFRMWGVLAEDAYFVDEGDGRLDAEIEVLPSWRDRVEEVAPHTALSVYLMGDKDDDGNIVSIAEDVQNGVDLVVHPGREGSGLVEKLYESAKPNVDPANPADNDEKDGLRMEKDVEERFTRIETLVQNLVDSKDKELQAQVDADAIQTESDKRGHAVAEAFRAIDASRADLLPSQIASLQEAAERGEDVTAAIESHKNFNAEAREAFGSGDNENGEGGRLGEGLTGSALDLGKVLL